MARYIADPEDDSLEMWPVSTAAEPAFETVVAEGPPSETIAEAWPVVETKEEPSSLAIRPPSEVQGRINNSFGSLATPLQELPEPLSDWSPTPVTEGLAGLVRTKITRDDVIMKQAEQRLEEDRARIRRAYDATGVQPGELLPWDYDKQRQKFATNPLESFGSIGSVFAILASAFTRDPMTNALNGAAAAMNAVREGNDKEYAKAYDAWQKNNDLTVKRHNIQQHAYDNAIRLMDSDLNLGRAKLQMEAARFGDQKTLWLLENGMDKEAIDLQRQRAEAVKSTVEASTALTQDGFRRQAFKAMMKDYDTQAAEISGQSPAEIAGRKLALFNHVFGKATPVPQEAFGLLLLGMPDAPIEKVIQKAQDMGIMPHRVGSNAMNTPAEIARRAKEYETDPNSPTFGDHAASYDRAAREVKAATAAPAREGSQPEFIARRSKEIMTENPDMKKTDADKQAAEEWKKANTAPKTLTTGGINAAEVERRKKDYMDQGMSEAEAFEKATKEVRAATASLGNPDLTIDRQNASAVAKQKETWRKEGMSEEEIATKGAEMAAKLKATATPPSANRRDQLASQIDRFTYASGTIDKVEALLKKHKALTGLGGTITRPGEVVSNWFGSNETDRAQFRRYVEELREWGPRLINESFSRPLSAEEKRIGAIVPGLNAGDTTANTARGLLELQRLFRSMREQMVKRREGTWTPDSLGAPPSAPSGGGWTPPAHDKPATGRRSALEDDEAEAAA